MLDDFNQSYYVGSFAGGSIQSPPAVQAISTERRWESAETNRLNAAHWQSVMEAHDINEDLTDDLQTLQRRCAYEVQNNPLIEGAIETHATDIGGNDGPSLEVRTSNKVFNEAVESLWSEWVQSCEYQHNLALVDLIHGWVAQLWYNGEFLCQDVYGDRALDYKLIDIGADRLDFSGRRNKNTVMGIEVNDSGQPVAYWVTDLTLKAKSRRIPADLMHHGFRRRFAGQLRGIPILAGGLQPSADLRDYETQVMDAARAAADAAIWMVTDHVDAQYVPLKPTDSWSVHRRTARASAPGWKPMGVAATQPAATHRNFKEDKERDIGLPGEMPLMVLRNDSSKHNLSSASYDGVRYGRSVSRIQSWINRRILNQALMRLITLARLDGTLRIDAPGRVLATWAWPKPPSNDPFKEAMAQRIRLENGTSSLTEEIGATGGRPDQVLDRRAKDNELLKDLGLPQIIGSVPTDVTDYLTLLHENQDQVDQSIVNNYDQEDDNADQEQI